MKCMFYILGQLLQRFVKVKEVNVMRMSKSELEDSQKIDVDYKVTIWISIWSSNVCNIFFEIVQAAGIIHILRLKPGDVGLEKIVFEEIKWRSQKIMLEYNIRK